MSTNFFVVQAQRDLADAQDIELRPRLDYQKSHREFERVQEARCGRPASAAGRRTGTTTR